MQPHCTACTPNESACIVQWDGDELLYVIPRQCIQPHEIAMRRNRDNWPRMLMPLTPHSPLGLDDLQDWAFAEDL
jgi:hypothetical protein